MSLGGLRRNYLQNRVGSPSNNKKTDGIMKDLKVTRTTFEVAGVKTKCIIVSNGYTDVRISKSYIHEIVFNQPCLLMVEYLKGERKKEDVSLGDFDKLTDKEAIAMAKKFSDYL